MTVGKKSSSEPTPSGGAIDKKKKKSKSKTGGPPRYGSYVQKAFKDIKERRGKGKFKNLTISANSLNALDLLIDHVLDGFIYNAEKTCAYAKTSKDPKSNNSLLLKHVEAAAKAALSGRLTSKTTAYAHKAVEQFHDAPEAVGAAEVPAEPVAAD